MKTQQNYIETVTIQKYQNIPCENNLMGDIFFLDEDDLSSIVNLQETVVNNLNSADIFQSDSSEFIQSCLTHGIIGVIVEEQLIAYRVIYFPKHNDDNLGIDLSFPKEMLSKVAHLESVVVHPDYRGNSLALKMNVQALNIIRTLKYNHVCVTVSPKNVYNLNVVFKLGFMIKALKMKYGDKLRYILYKDLEEESSFNPKENVAISSTNIDTLQNALQQGFIGYKMNKMADGFIVVFGKN